MAFSARFILSLNPYFRGVTVLKDTNGRLASLVAASRRNGEITREAARTVIKEAIYHIGFVTMQNIRGSYHHAMSNLCELANSVYTLLAQVRGREGYAERFVERFLSPGRARAAVRGLAGQPRAGGDPPCGTRAVGMDTVCVDAGGAGPR